MSKQNIFVTEQNLSKIVSLNYDETNKYIYFNIPETSITYYDGTIDFGNNIAYFPLSDFNENSTLLITIEEMSGNNIFTSESILSSAAEYPLLAAIKGTSDVMYFYNSQNQIPAYASIWSSAWSYPWKEMINGTTITRNTPATSYSDNSSSYDTWTEDTSNIQTFNGFIALNLGSNKTSETELTKYTTNSSLTALKDSGAIYSTNETLKISCFKVWKNKTFDSIAAAEASTETPDIWLRLDEDGNPVNAGTSGNIVYTGYKSSTINS